MDIATLPLDTCLICGKGADEAPVLCLGRRKSPGFYETGVGGTRVMKLWPENVLKCPRFSKVEEIPELARATDAKLIGDVESLLASGGEELARGLEMAFQKS